MIRVVCLYIYVLHADRPIWFSHCARVSGAYDVTHSAARAMNRTEWRVSIL